MFSAKLTESLRINFLVDDNSPWKNMTAAMVGITKVAKMVESKNLTRKDHGFLMAFIPFSGPLRLC
jgi:hypothetical protein